MLGPACCLLLAAFSSSVVEAAIGVDGEVAAGRAPLDYAGDPKNSLLFTLTPGVGLRDRARYNTLTLSYTPRIFYRLPNALNVDHPLILHQVGLDHTLEAGKYLSWASSAQLSVGQIDYTAAGVVFDPTVSSAVRTSITDIFRTTANTGLKYRIDPRLTLTWDAGVEYTTTLDQADVTPATGMAAVPRSAVDVRTFGTVIPDSFQARTKQGLLLSIGRASHFGGGAELTYQWFKDTARYLVLSPELEWDSSFGQRMTLGLAGGVAYVWTLDAANPQERKNTLGGTGSITLDSLIYRGLGTTSNLKLDASVEWYFDPILGTSQPRAGFTLTNRTSFRRRWTLLPSVAFYTVLKTVYYRPIGPNGMVLPPDPNLPNSGSIVSPDATIARVEFPISYQLSDAASIAFGMRAAMRGPPLQAPGPFDEQYEFWAFVGLTLRVGTSPDNGAWLSL